MRDTRGSPPQAGASAESRFLVYRIYALFLLSGTAGLVYQVVWSRVLHEIFGVTVYAVTTVLATFLGGLALGGFVLGRFADRRVDPLKLYGFLELGIALTALLGLVTVRALDPLHMWAANRWSADSAALIGVRFLLGSLVVLPPTFLMGGTLPVITRALVRRMQSLGRELSLLYALNTLGAVIGSLAAGFLLIRALGLHATLGIAVAVNVLVGIAALALAAMRGTPHAEADMPAARTGTGRERTSGLLVVIALSGVVTLGLEVLWTRVLMLSIGTTTYAFVTMLASFLGGITLGSFIARWLVERGHDLRRAFGWIQVGIATSTLLTLPLINAGVTQRWLTGWGGNWMALIALRFGVSLLVMLFPAVLIGMTFPVAAKIWTRELGRLGRELGQVYGANTAGNIFGAVVTGFVVLPALGLQKGIVLLAALSLTNAAWGFAGAKRQARSGTSSLAVVAGFAAVVVLLLVWQPRPLPVWGEQPGDETLYYREGVVATVKVIRKANDPGQLWMAVDAITIGQSSGGVDAKQQALAHFPFLLLPRAAPRDILSIGLGTGILVGEAAKHDSVQRIDCLEISPSVIEAARVFAPFNSGAMDNPRIRVINDDGVNFLRRSRASYDAIISDAKSRTTHAANGLFFSSEYYELCRRHLQADGLMIQWVPLSVPVDEMEVILRTFVASFEHSYVLLAPPHACFVVGSKRPLVLDLDHVKRQLGEPATARLRRYGVDDAVDFAGLLVADHQSLGEWLSRGRALNSLEHPILEFYSPRAHAVHPSRRTDDNVLALVRHARTELTQNLEIVGRVEELLPGHAAVTRLSGALARLERGDATSVSQALDGVRGALRAAPRNRVVGYGALAAYRRAVALVPDDARVRRELAELLRLHGAPGEAGAHDRRATELDGARGESR